MNLLKDKYIKEYKKLVYAQKIYHNIYMYKIYTLEKNKYPLRYIKIHFIIFIIFLFSFYISVIIRHKKSYISHAEQIIFCLILLFISPIIVSGYMHYVCI